MIIKLWSVNKHNNTVEHKDFIYYKIWVLQVTQVSYQNGKYYVTAIHFNAKKDAQVNLVETIFLLFYKELLNN